MYLKKTNSQSEEKKEFDCKTPYKNISNIVKKGFMTKQGGIWKSWNRRCFILTDDSLRYYKNEDGEPKPDDHPEGGVHFLGSIDVVSAEEITKRKNCLRITTPDREWYFCAESPQEMNNWIQAFRAVMEKCVPRIVMDFSTPKPEA
jgi:hypothetical protein